MDLRRRLLSRESFLSVAVVAVSVAVLVVSVDVSRSLSMIASADPVFYLAALALYYLPFLVRGQRWRLLLERAGVDVDLAESTEVTFLSFFANNLVPAQLGDVYRGHLLGKRKEESRPMVVGTVFADRLVDLVALVVLVTGLGYVILAERFWEVRYLLEGYGLLVAAGLVFAAVVVLEPHRMLPSRLEDVYERFASGVSRSVGRDNLGAVAVLTVVLWLSVMVRVYLVSRAVGAELSFAVAGFLGLFMILVTIVPLTPAGLGVVEVVTAGLLTFLAVAPETTLSVVLLDRTITFVSVVVVGAVYQAWTEKDVL